MNRITAVARCLRQTNKSSSSPNLLTRNNNYPYLPKKLLNSGTQESHELLQSTAWLASKIARAPPSNQQPAQQVPHPQHMCIASYSTIAEAKAESGILRDEIEVKRAGESTRVKPSDQGNRNRESNIYRLSKLDQNMVITSQIVNLYNSPSKGDEEAVIQRVKTSLSKILSHYYPLAGKFGISPEGELIVECTDDGVMFMEAEANCELDEVMPWLDHADTMKKFAYEVQPPNVLESPLLTIQLTRFQCGGYAVGISMHHCMADGISEGEFFTNWGRIARGLSLDPVPFLDRAIPRDIDSQTSSPRRPAMLQINETSTSDEDQSDVDPPLEYGTFVFDEDKISRLKSLAMKDGVISKCSTFDVLTAFIWKARAKAFVLDSNQPINLFFAMDVRSKFKTPLPKGFFGNAIVVTGSLSTAGELREKPLSHAVKLVQDAKKMVNQDYVRSFIDNYDPSMSHQSLTTNLIISSWCELGFDAVDYGSGNPVYTGPAVLPVKEIAIFLPIGNNNKGVIVKMGLPRFNKFAFQDLVNQV